MSARPKASAADPEVEAAARAVDAQLARIHGILVSRFGRQLGPDELAEVKQLVRVSWFRRFLVARQVPTRTALIVSCVRCAIGLLRDGGRRVSLGAEEIVATVEATLAAEDEAERRHAEAQAASRRRASRLEQIERYPEDIAWTIARVIATRRPRDRAAAEATARELVALCLEGVPFEALLARELPRPDATGAERVAARNRLHQRHRTFRKSMRDEIEKAHREGALRDAEAARKLRALQAFFPRHALQEAPGARPGAVPPDELRPTQREARA